jgi:hypothetical protein
VSIHGGDVTYLAPQLKRQVFRGNASELKSQLARRDFEQDCADGIWIRVNLPETTRSTRVGITREFGTTLGVRTLDSLRVARALELNAERFQTFDERQARLAQAVGLDASGWLKLMAAMHRFGFYWGVMTPPRAWRRGSRMPRWST